jgi:hypothetical protein
MPVYAVMAPGTGYRLASLSRGRYRLNRGDLVPADCMIDEGTVDVDQAALTGESTAESHRKGTLSIPDRRLRVVRQQELSPPQAPEATLDVLQSW